MFLGPGLNVSLQPDPSGLEFGDGLRKIGALRKAMDMLGSHAEKVCNLGSAD